MNGPGKTIAGKDNQTAMVVREDVSHVDLGGLVQRAVKIAFEKDRLGGSTFDSLRTGIDNKFGSCVCVSIIPIIVWLFQ